jgi:starvation-inducible outer membrane lipoprotein
MFTDQLFARKFRLMTPLLLTAAMLLSACQSTQPAISKAAYDLGTGACQQYAGKCRTIISAE